MSTALILPVVCELLSISTQVYLVHRKTVIDAGREEELLSSRILAFIKKSKRRYMELNIEEVYKEEEEVEDDVKAVERAIESMPKFVSKEKRRLSSEFFNPRKIYDEVRKSISRSSTPLKEVRKEVRTYIDDEFKIHPEFEEFVKKIITFIAHEVKVSDSDSVYLKHQQYNTKLVKSLAEQAKKKN